ncbi:hypothetical protein ACWDZ4_20700 [Streptomyces sp. NPDC003016]
MSNENATTVDHGDLALRAAVAYQVLEKVKGICQPVIDANADHVKTTKGLRSTTAELPEDDDERTMPLVAFSKNYRQPYFFFKDTPADRKAFLDYADEHDETVFIVRPGFETAILRSVIFDPGTGKVVDRSGEEVPGIGYDKGGEVISVSPKWANGGKKLLNDRLWFLDKMLENLPTLTASDFLGFLPAIPPGTSEEAQEAGQ